LLSAANCTLFLDPIFSKWSAALWWEVSVTHSVPWLSCLLLKD